jgi:site-specific recombinase XerD
MLLRDAIEKYLLWKGTETRTASKVYRPFLEHLYQHVGNKDTLEITLEDISQFRASLKLKYNDGNIANHNNVIKNFYKWQEALRITTVHPFLIRNPRVIAPESPVATPEEVKQMCGTLNENSYGDLMRLVAIRLMWESMIRVSELADLNMCDIVSHKNYTEIIGKKNYKKRWIMWSPETHQLLLKYVEKRKAFIEHDALFAHEKGGVTQRMNTRSIERWIKIARDKVGIKTEISCHALRHGGAHELVKKGASLKFIGLILGHSDNNPRAGMQYLRFSKEESLDVVNRFVGLRFNESPVYSQIDSRVPQFAGYNMA